MKKAAERAKTIPWHLDEYMGLDGRLVVYTLRHGQSKSRAEVHIPGATWKARASIPTVGELVDRGHRLREPLSWRYDG